AASLPATYDGACVFAGAVICPLRASTRQWVYLAPRLRLACWREPRAASVAAAPVHLPRRIGRQGQAGARAAMPGVGCRASPLARDEEVITRETNPTGCPVGQGVCQERREARTRSTRGIGSSPSGADSEQRPTRSPAGRCGRGRTRPRGGPAGAACRAGPPARTGA